MVDNEIIMDTDINEVIEQGGKKCGKKLFTSIVKTTKNDQAAMEEEESKNDEEIVIRKLLYVLYNFVIEKSIKRDYKRVVESLIVKLMGRKFFLMPMKKRLTNLWDKMKSIKVIDLGCEFFLVRFFSSKDLGFSLTENFWKILEYYLLLPGLNFQDLLLSIKIRSFQKRLVTSLEEH
ncbi:hypothetical protein Ahy_A07g034598 [Arachis hypogaea]|uniref:DUF4283 domain-containing protein n=1 Tax=Arachis hypogaea TaxID=3818 RepID=A0A445CCI4_ARAHY|nr:hypothetical protein Ahy_A07g034598 [Arachis hypogaea]